MRQVFHIPFAVALNAFQGFLRERILYNIFFVSLFLLFFGYMASLLVFGHQDRVMLHFGTMINALSVYVVAAGAGSRVLRNEVEQRTCYLPLTRPVSRASYFMGKWIGVISFTAINLLLLTLILGIGLRMVDGQVNLAFGQSVMLIWIETLFIAALSLFLSLFLRQGLSNMVCMAYLFLSHNHEQISYLKAQGSDAGGLFTLFEHFTPNAQLLLMDTRVYYDSPLTSLELFTRMGYGILWALFFLLLGNAFFYRKNL